MFVEHEAPEEIEEATFDSDGGMVHLPAVMAEQFGMSRSEARRLIDQGGVTLGERPARAGEHDVPAERADGQVLKVGKRRFRRLRAAEAPVRAHRRDPLGCCAQCARLEGGARRHVLTVC